jgi:hypothetical protein
VKCGETDRHVKLKALSLAWAQDNGFPLAATEVRIPRSGYRADVAAIGKGEGGRGAIFECKQARADFLRDSRAEEEATRKVCELAERLERLVDLIGGHRPDLRKGESLFAEYDAVDLSGIEHETHRKLVAELAAWQERRRHGTKFARLYRWRAADYLYLVAEPGIYAEADIPAGWGLLIRRGEELILERRPFWTEPVAAGRRLLLEAIATAATRVVNREFGVKLAGRPETGAAGDDTERTESGKGPK